MLRVSGRRRRAQALAVWAVLSIATGCDGGDADDSPGTRDLAAFEVEKSCQTCKVQVYDPILLDSTRLPGFNNRSKLAFWGTGDDALVAFGPTDDDGQFVVLPLHGAGSANVLGRFGEGPNEMPRLRTLAFAGPDTLVLLHSNAISLFSLRDSTSSRQNLPPGVSSFELVVSGGVDRTIVIGNHVPTHRRIVTQSFGGLRVNEFMGRSLGPGVSLDGLGPLEYHLALQGSDTVIAVPKQEVWESARWSLRGDSLGAGFLAAPSWFVPFTEAGIDQAREAKDSAALASITYVSDMDVIGGHYLAVIGRVPDTRPVPAKLESGGAWNYANDTVLDVYDLDTLQLVSRVRFDAVYTYLMPPGFLVRYLEDDNGFITVSVRQVNVASR